MREFSKTGEGESVTRRGKQDIASRRAENIPMRNAQGIDLQRVENIPMRNAQGIDLHLASSADIDLLVPLRLEVLRAANGFAPGAEMPGVEMATRRYYEARLAEPSGPGETALARAAAKGHIEYLAFVGGALAGCGAASLYAVMPTSDTPTGQKAYIMNMYTRPAFRRQGVARAVLSALVAALRGLGINHITLEATPAGRPLYEANGFTPLADEMMYTGEPKP